MKFLFHFGMPKAGSTTLQQAVLEFPEIAYLLHPDQAFIEPEERKKFFDIWNQSKRESEFVIHPLKHKSIQKLMENKSIKTCFVSCENAVTLETPQTCCRRTMQLKLPNQEALFIVRRPSDLVRSLYDMLPYDLNGDWISASKFEENFMLSEIPYYTRLRSWIDYRSSIQILKSSFGEENLHVFRFEDVFRSTMTDQFRQLACCLGVPADRLHAVLQGRKANKASDHLASIAARRVLKGVHLSRFLPSSLLMKTSILLSRSLSFMHRKTVHEFALVKEGYDDFLYRQ